MSRFLPSMSVTMAVMMMVMVSMLMVVRRLLQTHRSGCLFHVGQPHCVGVAMTAGLGLFAIVQVVHLNLVARELLCHVGWNLLLLVWLVSGWQW